MMLLRWPGCLINKRIAVFAKLNQPITECYTGIFIADRCKLEAICKITRRGWNFYNVGQYGGELFV